jgi:hypothetical protein
MLEKNSDSEVHVEKIEQRPTASIAFGLERIGLIAVQAPILGIPPIRIGNQALSCDRI